MNRPAPETTSLVAGGFAALGASTCCVLPLALVSAGFGGVWIAQLRELERLQWLFIGVAAAAFAYAFYRLYLKPVACAADGSCASPVLRRRNRIAFWVTLVAAKALILFPFVYGYALA